jgi:hypothetical protein
MITPQPEPAWLEADEWEGDNGLLGNRRGLEALRGAIDQVLMNPDAAIIIPVDEGSIRILKLCNPSPPPEPCSLQQRILLVGLVALFLFILFLGLTSLIALVASLFS